MKFRYLGTAAAEGIPAIFCDCERCQKARELGGRDVRHRSGAMVNGDVLIDLAPDLYAMKLGLDLDLARVRHIVFTHAHSDHLAGYELEMFLPGYAHIRDRGLLTLYGSAYTGQCVREAIRRIGENAFEGVEAFREVAPFAPFDAGGVTFTALPSVHGCPGSYIYLVEQDGVRLLYGNDSGRLKPEVLDYLRAHGPLTHVSLDTTNGELQTNYDGHMGFTEVRETREQMLAMGIANASTRFICNHFSHNGVLPYDEMRALMAPHGFDIAYDGMRLI